MGETLADTVRRLRLQAFSRAFSQAHLVPPSTYRLNTQAAFARSEQARFCLVQSSNLLQPTALTATIVISSPVRVVALRHNGKYTSINTSFQRLTAWAVGRGLLENSARMFGMYYDDPASKPSSQLLSDACIAVQMTLSLIQVIVDSE
jgi:AraC family transcriptional regulator